MLRHLSLKNFRCFREFDIELRPVTCILGQNGAGKSSLLQAVALSMVTVWNMVASTDADGAPLRRVRRRAGDPAWPAGIAWRDLFHRSGGKSADAFEIVATFDGPGSTGRGRLALTAQGDGDGPEVEVYVETSALELERTVASSSPAAGSAVLLSHLMRVLPDERLISDVEMHHLEAEGRHDEIIRNGLARLPPVSIARINRTLRAAQGAELVRVTSIDSVPLDAPLEVILRRETSDFELAIANQGLLNSLRLLVQIERLQDDAHSYGMLLLDEPEAHLHPRAQATIAERLVGLAARGHVQLVSVTHAVEVARRLRYHDQGALYALSPKFGLPQRIETEEELVCALDRTHELAPFASINFVGHRQVFFHEGPSDHSILLSCARGFLRHQPARMQRFEAWTPVSLGGATNAPTADLLGYLVSTKLIRKLDVRDRISMVTVLDRDYEREPKVTETRNEQITHKKKVWGRYSIESLFLDAEILTPCLTILLDEDGVSVEELGRLVANAVTAANREPSLLEPAEVKLAEVYQRTRRQRLSDALMAARAEVRAHPEIWQHGRYRASFILGHVRRALPTRLQRKVRSTIEGMLEDIPTDRFSSDMVPNEIQDLLELLAA
ncbi:MAG: AAA family ATPase [Minicystis sp.]